MCEYNASYVILLVQKRRKPAHANVEIWSIYEIRETGIRLATIMFDFDISLLLDKYIHNPQLYLSVGSVCTYSFLSYYLINIRFVTSELQF